MTYGVNFKVGEELFVEEAKIGTRFVERFSISRIKDKQLKK